MSKTAHILALRASSLAVHGLGVVGVTGNPALVADALTQAQVWVGPRPVLEQDPAFLQVIPYIMLRDQRGELFSYRRGGAGGEHRLHAKQSIGFGGHVDGTDAVYLDDGSIDLEDTLAIAAQRELGEEVGLHLGAPRWTHLVRMDANEVDRVHLGFVGVVDLTPEQAAGMTLEETVTETVWAAPHQMLEAHTQGVAEFESWSHALLQHLTKNPR